MSGRAVAQAVFGEGTSPRVEVLRGGVVVLSGPFPFVLALNVASLMNGDPLRVCQACGQKPATHSGAGDVRGDFCPDCNVGGG